MSVLIVQQKLKQAGFDPGALDGVWGLKTAAALDEALGLPKAPAVAPVADGDRFSVCLPLILKHEGGYVDHPKDPGGATNLGVTQATLSEWLGRTATKAEVKALTPATVAPIYRKNYWDAVSADALPIGVDYVAFDCGVNHGPARARKWLQAAANVKADGALGPVSMEAIKAAGAAEMIRRLGRGREAFYRRLNTFPTFGKGWLRRNAEVTAKALEMAVS